MKHLTWQKLDDLKLKQIYLWDVQRMPFLTIPNIPRKKCFIPQPFEEYSFDLVTQVFFEVKLKPEIQ